VTAMLAATVARGYDGVVAPAAVTTHLSRFVARAAESGLAFVPQLFTWGPTVDDHLSSFRSSLEQVVRWAPRYAIAQAGRDSFSDDDARRFFREALAVVEQLGVPVAFETHRQRILFTPWRTLRLLEEFPRLELNCDLSHWVCVGERLKLGRDTVARCGERALQIDARVGFEEGPQVSDPRAPEFDAHLEAHLGWWDEIWERRAAAGAEVLSVMPEFGPPPYQPVLPFGGGPIGDRDDINHWMADTLRQRLQRTP
jgi:hypothetical protein